MQRFTKESLEFQEKILARSGLGQDTYLPPGRLHILSSSVLGQWATPNS